MMPFSGAPRNKKRPLPSTEQTSPESDEGDKDLEAMVAGCSREELEQLQEMVSARLEGMEEAPASDPMMEGEDEQA